MRILVLGATGLTGRAVVDAAVAGGHEVTGVHRGRSSSSRGAALPEGVESIILDRVEGHASLVDRAWDAIIDVSGYAPAIVRDMVERLDRPELAWVYISTVSVYDEDARPMRDESAGHVDFADDETRTAARTDPGFDWSAPGMYGAAKAYCERELAPLAGRVAILRPVVIAGAYDHTWRCAYWVDRAMRGGEILAPAPREQSVSIVDVRDLAEFAVRCAEHRTVGEFNIAPDPATSTMGALVDTSVDVADTDATVTWVAGDALEAADVAPWSELPFWLPDTTGAQGMNAFASDAARAAGFTNRPLRETIEHVHAWLAAATPTQLPDRATTLTADRERALLHQLAR